LLAKNGIEIPDQFIKEAPKEKPQTTQVAQPI